MLIQYIGMFDEVRLPDWVDDRGYPKPAIKRREPVDVDGELAQRLLEQVDNWAVPEKPRTSRRPDDGANAGAAAPEE